MTLIELVEHLIGLLQLAIAWCKIRHAQNKRASSLVLQCDKTRQAFEKKSKKCRKHEPQANVFYISRVFSNVRNVLSQCNTRLRLLYLLYDIVLM